MRRAVLTTVCVLSVLLFATPALAGNENGQVTLEFLESLEIHIDNTGGNSIRIVADFEVTEGVPVNIFFTNKEGYDDFKDPMEWQFSYYEAYSQNNTKDYHKEFTWSESGDFYFIVTNSGYSSMDTSKVEYDVEWTSGGFLGFPWWCWIIAIVIIIIALGLGWILRIGRRGGGTETPPGDTPPPEPSPPPLGEDETWEGAQVYEGPVPMPLEEGETSPMATTVPMEDTAGILDGSTELGPQPEPPDAESPAMRATPEGHTELSPQPEPPDAEMPAMRATPGTHTELSPQPEPPDMKIGDEPPPDDGPRLDKKGHDAFEESGDGPTGEPL